MSDTTPASPQEYVQQKAASSGSSFYYAFLFLPPERRAAIVAFYAFCREVDDVVDEVEDPGVAQAKLAWWHNEVHQAYAGQPTHPVMRALMPWTDRFGIEHGDIAHHDDIQPIQHRQQFRTISAPLQNTYLSANRRQNLGLNAMVGVTGLSNSDENFLVFLTGGRTLFPDHFFALHE